MASSIKFNLQGRLEVLDSNPIDGENGSVAVVDQDTFSVLLDGESDYSIYDHKNKTLNIGDTLVVDHPTTLKFIMIKSTQPVELLIEYATGSATLTVERVFQILGEFTKVTVTGTVDNTYVRVMALGKIP